MSIYKDTNLFSIIVTYKIKFDDFRQSFASHLINFSHIIIVNNSVSTKA